MPGRQTAERPRANNDPVFMPDEKKEFPMQTVIGTFDDTARAQQALERLAQTGFARDDLHLQAGRRSAYGSAADVQDRGVLTAIGHFMVSAFGKDHHERHAERYTDAVGRGGALVMADADDPSQADRAASLMRELGATAVDDVRRDSQPRLRDIARRPAQTEVSSNMEGSGESTMLDRQGERAMATPRVQDPSNPSRDPDASLGTRGADPDKPGY
jgi:hypothetical protein